MTEAARILGVDRRTVIRWRASGRLAVDATRAELEEMADQRRQNREETPVRLSCHAQRLAERKAEAKARLEDLVKAGQLTVRRLTPADLKRLEQGRARRLLPDDRQAA